MKKIITAVLCLSFLSACKTEAAVTTTSATTVTTTSETTTVTTAAATTTTTAPVTTEKTVSMEKYWIDEYEWRLSRQENREYVELSSDTKFYECEYTQDVIYDGESYPNADFSERAQEFFHSTQAYLDIYAQALEYYKEDGGNADSFTVNSKLVQATVFDFNNDGKEESAFLFSLSPADSMLTADEAAFMAICCAIDYNAPRYLVLMDCDGNLSLSDMNYAGNAELYRLRYRDFSHLVISGGVSNNSSCADFFSVKEKGFEHELREFQAYSILDGIFLCQTMVQVSDNWLIFWNEENDCYVTPEVTYLNPEESLEISADFPERFSRPVTVIGGIYSEYGGQAYRLIDGEFQPMHEAQTGIQAAWYDSYGERHTPISREFYIPYAKNFDYATALQNIITIDN